MLKIRLNKKKGIKKKPNFYIVLTESKYPRDGKFIEKLGYYNPISKNIFINIKKYNYWINLGAKLTLAIKKLKKIFIKNF